MYVILPVNWEYNDETYDDKGFDLPEKGVYETREAAKLKADAMTVKHYREMDEWEARGYGNEEMGDSQAYLYDLGLGEDIIGIYVPRASEMTDEQVLTLLKHANVKFYEVAEV